MSDFAVKVAEAVERGRVNAESLMTDTVRVTRSPPPLEPGEEPPTDEWGNILEPDPVTVYEGRGKFQHSDPYPSQPDAGEARWVMGVRQVHLPYGTTSARSGDVAECVSSQNPRLVGLKVRLRIDGDKSWTTAVRFNAQETVGEAG